MSRENLNKSPYSSPFHSKHSLDFHLVIDLFHSLYPPPPTSYFVAARDIKLYFAHIFDDPLQANIKSLDEYLTSCLVHRIHRQAIRLPTILTSHRNGCQPSSLGNNPSRLQSRLLPLSKTLPHQTQMSKPTSTSKSQCTRRNRNEPSPELHHERFNMCFFAVDAVARPHSVQNVLSLDIPTCLHARLLH